MPEIIFKNLTCYNEIRVCFLTRIEVYENIYVTLRGILSTYC